MVKKLIFTAYAQNEQMQTGANMVRERNSKKLYWENAIVSLCSAKTHMPNCDVALVANVEVSKVYKIFYRRI